jgi:hypothetical protein
VREMTLLLGLLSAVLSMGQDVGPLLLEKEIALPGVEGRIDHFSVDVSGQRLFIAALENGSVEILDARQGERTAEIKGLEEPQALCQPERHDRSDRVVWPHWGLAAQPGGIFDPRHLPSGQAFYARVRTGGCVQRGFSADIGRHRIARGVERPACGKTVQRLWEFRAQIALRLKRLPASGGNCHGSDGLEGISSPSLTEVSQVEALTLRYLPVNWPKNVSWFDLPVYLAKRFYIE